MHRSLSFLAAAAFALAGCDDSTAALAEATFRAELGAPRARVLAGQADFVPDLPLSGIGTAFRFQVRANAEPGAALRHSVALFRHSTDPIAPGVYTIDVLNDPVDPEVFVGSVAIDQDGAAFTCSAMTGEIEV